MYKKNNRKCLDKKFILSIFIDELWSNGMLQRYDRLLFQISRARLTHIIRIFVRVARVILEDGSIDNVAELFVHVDCDAIAHPHKQVHEICSFSEKKGRCEPWSINGDLHSLSFYQLGEGILMYILIFSLLDIWFKAGAETGWIWTLEMKFFVFFSIFFENCLD